MKPVHVSLLALLLVLPCLAATPGAREGARVSDTERARILSRFDHARHSRAVEKAGLGCLGCHQVGGRSEAALTPEADRALLAAPRGACHACHDGGADRKVRGPVSCAACHGSAMRPADHGADYKVDHGEDARLSPRGCVDCHARTWCTDCHDRKDTTRYRVHDRTWLSVHGVDALTDPASCTACHLQADCVACHSTVDGRLP